MKQTVFILGSILILLGSIQAKNANPRDISTIAAAGHVSGDKYFNAVLGITVAGTRRYPAIKSLDNIEEGRARLVQILSKQSGSEDSYTFAVLADTLSRYPQLQSPAHYVRSVRHQLEKEGFVTLKEEFPITIGGLNFTGAVLQQQVAATKEHDHCRGLYTTFLKGVIVSFDVEAATEQTLQRLVTRSVEFGK